MPVPKMPSAIQPRPTLVLELYSWKKLLLVQKPGAPSVKQTLKPAASPPARLNLMPPANAQPYLSSGWPLLTTFGVR